MQFNVPAVVCLQNDPARRAFGVDTPNSEKSSIQVLQSYRLSSLYSLHNRVPSQFSVLFGAWCNDTIEVLWSAVFFVSLILMFILLPCTNVPHELRRVFDVVKALGRRGQVEDCQQCGNEYEHRRIS